jgi:hypothetical protein
MARIITYTGKNKKNFPGRYSQTWALVDPATFEKMKRAGAGWRAVLARDTDATNDSAPPDEEPPPEMDPLLSGLGSDRPTTASRPTRAVKPCVLR